MNAESIYFPKRLAIYLSGIIMVSLGIVLCKKCGLGISPISSIPFVLEDIIPLSFGTLTMLYHLINILLQMIVGGKITKKILLQIPIAVIFGQVIDLFQKLLTYNADTIFLQLLSLILSVVFTALGMVFMINMQLVQNPPDGFVHMLSVKVGKELGQIKILYDISCVLISLIISFVCLRHLKGFGLATIVSALTVGKLVSFIIPYFTSVILKQNHSNN